MLRRMASWTATLWLLQTLAGALVQMALAWPWLALALTGAYLGLVGVAAAGLRRQAAAGGWWRQAGTALAVGVLWQLPALLGSVNQWREQLRWTPYDGNSDLLDFAMQTWQTPLLPLLRLLPVQSGVRDAFGAELAGYYVGLVAAGPLLTPALAAAAAWPVRGAARGAGAREEVAAARAPDPAPGGWAPARRWTEAARSGRKKVR